MTELAGKPADLGTWLQWYAFDNIGQLTFSKMFGCMQEKVDRNNIMEGIDKGVAYASIIGQIPELHPWLLGNDWLVRTLTAMSQV